MSFVFLGVKLIKSGTSGLSNQFVTLCLCFSLDPTRMLVNFGASTVVQDNFHGNTALHWAIVARNSTAVTTLAINGANLGIRNNAVCIFRVIVVCID